MSRLVAGGLAAYAVLVLAIHAHAHVDDPDSALYTVIARNLAKQHAWTNLSYLPNVYPEFREHLPFGLWPQVVAIRFLGEPALPYLSSLWTLVTLALVGWMGNRLGGPQMGLIAAFLLMTTEQFMLFGARPRLDPLLVLLATLAAAPLLVGRANLRTFTLATLAAALACLIKGPFGLVPLFAAASARALIEKQWRWLLIGSTASLLATAPVATFLLWNKLRGDGSWWNGYVEGQLLASALGTRSDGDFSPFFPLLAVANRFWPYLPLLPLSLWAAWRERRLGRATPLLAVASLVGIFLLALPRRKLWHHPLVLYPFLVLLIASAALPWLERALRSPWKRRAVALGAGTIALCIAVAALTGFSARQAQQRAVACTDFFPVLSTLPKGELVLVDADSPWRELGALAREFEVTPWLVEKLPDQSDPTWPSSPRWALAEDAHAARGPSSCQPFQRARGWVLLSCAYAR